MEEEHRLYHECVRMHENTLHELSYTLTVVHEQRFTAFEQWLHGTAENGAVVIGAVVEVKELTREAVA
eukprot:2620224-Prymnesium_polylepis.1